MIGKKIKKPWVDIGESKSFNVAGKSFFRITGVYLSGSPGVFPNTTFFNPFSASSKLSASYVGISGIQLNSVNYFFNGDSQMTFTCPSALSAGYVDIILQNDAGWGA